MLDFVFSHEQQLIAEAVAGRLDRLGPLGGGRDAALHLLGELDGLGLFDHEVIDCVTATAIAFELGSRLAPVPWADWLAAAIAFSPDGLDMHELAERGLLLACPLHAKTGIAGTRAVGSALLPVMADVVVLPDPRTGGTGWLLVRDGIAGKAASDVIDHSVEAARIEFDGETIALDRANDRDFGDIRRLLVLGEMVGIARACFRKTVAYARDRKQFGRPIGSYQALKHMAADAAVQLEAMTAAVEYAAWCLDAPGASAGERRAALLTASAIVGDKARKIAEDCIQMHGGIAFTWDYGLHHYFKRIVFRRNTAVDPRQAGKELAGRMTADPKLLENAALEAP